MSKRESIPVLEMGNPETPEFYNAVGAGLERIGFIILTGHHGVSATLLARACEIMDQVFGLSIEQKLAYGSFYQF